MRWESDHGVDALRKCAVTEENNYAILSRLSSLEGSFHNPQYGLKYVISGQERYYFHGKDHVIRSGEFLLVNRDQQYECSFRESETVHGYCLNIDHNFLEGVFTAMRNSESYLLDNLEPTNNSIEIFETVYSAAEPFSRFLASQVDVLTNAGSNFDGYNFYEELSFRLLLSQKKTWAEIERIKASKSSTKKELYRRLYLAKAIMDEDPSQKLNIPLLARRCALSEFHFFRSFKAVFGKSPHQYILTKRLEKANRLLKEGITSITHIAYECGFNDIFSFSKSFRKNFKMAPSSIYGKD
jgi:AraC family transcriptional regulator